MTKRLTPWLLVIGFFLMWEAVCVALHVDRFILPRPSEIAVAGVRSYQAILINSWQTFFTTMAGFALAVVVGLFLGLLIGASPAIYNGLYPLIVGLNSIPKVAIVPVLVIWFGLGTVPAIITAFVISFFPIMVNVATGLATLEPELRDVLRALGARPYQILLKVGLPRSLPLLFASLKIAITLAFIGSVISETVASNEGIGYLMVAASSRFEVPLVFAGLLIVGAMGIGMYAICVYFERRMTRWAFRSQDLVS